MDYPGGLYDDEDDYVGPIVQSIPDGLMVGDYIVISGICQGEQVIVQLLPSTETAEAILPLSIQLAAMGPVIVMTKSKQHVQRMEYNVSMGLQTNMSFELCIYAQEAGFEIKLNKETICRQNHLVPLEIVGAISMDGDAEFTAIEFKDIYGDDDPFSPLTAFVPPPPGMVRVQEHRDSFSRKPGSASYIRDSTRGSKSNRKQWKTSEDLSRPHMDSDPPKYETLSQPTTDLQGSGSVTHMNFKPGGRDSIDLQKRDTYQHGVVGGANDKQIPGGHHHGSFITIDDENPTYRPIYNGSNTQLQNDQGSKSSLPTKRGRGKGHGRGTPSGSNPSLNSMSEGSTTSIRYSSSLYGPQDSYFEMAADRFPIRGPVPKSMVSSPPSEIAAFMAGQRPIINFEHFSLTGIKPPSKSSVTTNVHLNMNNDMQHNVPPPDYMIREPSPVMMVSEPPPAVMVNAPPPAFVLNDVPSVIRAERTITEAIRVKGPVPKTIITKSAPEIASHVAAQKAIEEFEMFSLTTVKPDPRISLVPAADRGQSISSEHRELTGSAPEMADILLDNKKASIDQETTLSGISPKVHEQNVTKEAEYIIAGKLTGSASEIAAIVIETGKESKHNNVCLIETSPIYQRTEKPGNVVKPAILVPVRVVDPVQTQYDPEGSDSDGISIHSGNESYIRVKRDDFYYKERVDSLKRRSSRRSRSRSRDRLDSRSSSVESIHVEAEYSSEGRIYMQSGDRQRVYAAPATVEHSYCNRLMIDSEELRIDKYMGELPLPLTPGRCVIVKGHYSEDCPEDQPCTIMLKTLVDDQADGLRLCRWKNGSMSIFQLSGEENKLITEWKSNEQSSTEHAFTLELHTRGLYLGVTTPDVVSLKVPCTFDLESLKYIALESVGSAYLDLLEVHNDLDLPVELIYPKSLRMEDTQSLIMKTKFTADNAGVLLNFKTESGATLLLVVDLTGESIHLRSGNTHTSGAQSFIIDEKLDMPFVPEQINELTIIRNCSENKLKVLANTRELFNHSSPIYNSIGILEQVTISGQITLLSARFN